MPCKYLFIETIVLSNHQRATTASQQEVQVYKFSYSAQEDTCDLLEFWQLLQQLMQQHP
jgi:hypothetical protein